MSVADPQVLVELAQRVAVQAGDVLMSRFAPADRGELAVASKSTATDAVSEMDLASERTVIEQISRVRPHDRFLAEEGTRVPDRDPSTTSGVTWVIDPLDGTVNYLYGLPHWGVSIAAMIDGAIVAGVVQVPVLREMFWAAAGRGAWHRVDEVDVRLTLGEGAPLDQALVATGFGYAASRRAEQVPVIAEVLPQVRDIRRLGAAALDLANVAAGRVDAYFERGLQPWDMAAGALIVREAGGEVTGVAGIDPPTSASGWTGAASDLVVAGPAPLRAELSAILRRAGA